MFFDVATIKILQLIPWSGENYHFNSGIRFLNLIVVTYRKYTVLCTGFGCGFHRGKSVMDRTCTRNY